MSLNDPTTGAQTLSIGATYLVHRPTSIPRMLTLPSRSRISTDRIGPATVLNLRKGRLGASEAYISFTGQDKRLDTWVTEKEIGDKVVEREEVVAGPSTLPLKSPGRSKRRKLAKPLSTPSRSSFTPDPNAKQEGREGISNSSSEDREHAALTRVRNFEDVRFGEYKIKTWYFSPYPLPPEETPHTQTQTHHTQTGTVNRNTNGAFSRKPKSTGPPVVVEPKVVPGDSGKGRNNAVSRSIGDLLGGGVGRGNEGARGRLWVCDLCFKYMRTRVAWEKHSSNCQQFLPPGRKVYQRGSYTIWEVDGSQATLYCQNLSLFGKLFIDHKSVFFHVENFLFYIMCDASTSYRDQPMAFFSKEKLSFDDYNLACIVTFPPFQGNGFGKLLIEFSYYLTKQPSTRPNPSPGTPERPLSDLGLKGYLAYWSHTILRYLRDRLADAPHVDSKGGKTAVNGTTPGLKADEGRKLRRRVSGGTNEGKIIEFEGHCMLKTDIPRHKSQYDIILSLSTLASACHLRVDDTSFTLSELGLLACRRPVTIPPPPKVSNEDEQGQEGENMRGGDSDSLGQWKDLEVVISREEVERLCGLWEVRERPMLDVEFVLL